MGSAFAFLTVFPGRPRPGATTFAWFPVVGAIIGVVVGAAWWGAAKWWPPAVAAALAVIADLAITGLLHHDGLADTADGVLPPHLARGRRLEVMRSPQVGAFAVAAVTIVVVARVGALASLSASIGLLAGVWCASRTVMALTAGWVPYAREEGLAEGLLGGSRWAAAYGVPAALAIGVVSDGARGAAAVAATLAGGVVVVWFGARRLGGFTGDLLGAAGLVGETTGLLVASGRW